MILTISKSLNIIFHFCYKTFLIVHSKDLTSVEEIKNIKEY